MRPILHAILVRRARTLADWLVPHLPLHGYLADIGAGTGHLGQALRRASPLRIIDIDVADMAAFPNPGVRYDGRRLPFGDAALAGALLVFVLPYCDQPAQLLADLARATSGPVLVLQSTYTGRAGYAALWLNEQAWGTPAFTIGRLAGLVRARRHVLAPRRYFTRATLTSLCHQAGWQAVLQDSYHWRWAPVRYDLYRLDRAAPVASVP